MRLLLRSILQDHRSSHTQRTDLRGSCHLLDGGLADALGALRTTFLEVGARYVRTSDSGPRGYAEQALEVEPEADPALLRADAVDVVQRFIEALGI